ncbi:hypothetical protein BSLA_01f1026 [Burkholderia stabilis]|nr:hypothetical protein BSLA_01f1026 [Burkholderia stabilis]
MNLDQSRIGACLASSRIFLRIACDRCGLPDEQGRKAWGRSQR